MSAGAGGDDGGQDVAGGGTRAPDDAPPASAGRGSAAHPPSSDERTSRDGASVGWGVALIAAGLLWILALLDVPIAWELVLPVGIIVIGISLVVGVRGAVRNGMIGLGTILTVAALVAMAVPSLAFTAGERDLRVGSVADLEQTYEHGAGVLRLDLRELDVPEGTTAVTARVNFGELVVLVPPDVTVTGAATARGGELAAFDRISEGLAPSIDLDDLGERAAHVVDLDLEVGFGRVEVRR